MRGVTAEPITPRPTKYKEFLKTLAENSTIWFTIVHKETGKFMGQCSIKVAEPVKNGDGLFGISMLPKFWGMGYGTEATRFTVDHAFRALGVQLNVSEGNEAAIAAYKKMWGNSNFMRCCKDKNQQLEAAGRKRRANCNDGHWEDSLSMGVLDEKWADMYWKN
ncbi:hypothetical protein BDR07DRAFT_1302842 [Suillus spraguei]|nr:hypothetical protein BDR07DRAFT_1302842 [Suillus spraguei]